MLLNYSLQMGDDQLFKQLTCVQKQLHKLFQNLVFKLYVNITYVKNKHICNDRKTLILLLNHI